MFRGLTKLFPKHTDLLPWHTTLLLGHTKAIPRHTAERFWGARGGFQKILGVSEALWGHSRRNETARPLRRWAKTAIQISVKIAIFDFPYFS